MGFFKKIAKAVVKPVNKALGTRLSVDGYSGLAEGENENNDILNQALDKALQVGLDYGENKLRDSLGNPKSSGGGSIMDRLGGFGSDLLSSSLVQWFKKNWYWVVIPIPVAIGIYFVVRNGKGKKKGKKWF